MQRLHKVAQPSVDRLWRIALVSAAVDADGRMVAYAFHVVVGVAQEHVLVERVGTVSRVGEPEVLPHHYAVSVTGFVELLVACLSHPVAYHVEVHVAVVSHRNVIFASAVAQVVLAESPVAAQRYEPSAVDVYLQLRVHVLVVHLAYARLECHGV